MTVFNDTFDKAAPAGTDDPSEADDNMRRIQASVQERENVDHYWPLTGTEVSDADAGEHRKATLRVGSAPTAVADKGFVYAKDVAGKAELFYRDEDGNEIQLTSGGKIGAATKDLTVNNATVAGTLGVTGVATLGDGSLLAAATESGDADRTIVDLNYAKTGDTAQHDAEGGFQNADVDGTKTKVYTKYFTGTLDNDASTSFAHGITGIDKILAVTASAFSTSTNTYFAQESGSGASGSVAYEVFHDATNIIFSSVQSAFRQQKYRVRIDYIL